MFGQYDPTLKGENQESEQLTIELTEFMADLLAELNHTLEIRLIQNFLLSLCAILRFRHTKYGLLLSELGANILDPQHAQAGTKRLDYLLNSNDWSAQQIIDFLWQRAEAYIARGLKDDHTVYALWDASVIEKPESLHAEGLCPVRSSKAARLKRIKPGYFNPPDGRPTIVPGFHWTGILLATHNAASLVANMNWWSSRGEHASSQLLQDTLLLNEVAQKWGRRVVHVFDRGYAGAPWLGRLLVRNVRFIIRWKSKIKLVDEQGQIRKTWEIARGKRVWDSRQIWDNTRHCWRKVGVLALAVEHEEYPGEQLYLVISRRKGLSPWYLLTNEPILSVEDAWRVTLGYVKRWGIETSWRYCKNELALESIRVYKMAKRLKLMMMLTLVYAFLLSLLTKENATLRECLLQKWCPRRGTRSKHTVAPLYRLREAISYLWTCFSPPVLSVLYHYLG